MDIPINLPDWLGQFIFMSVVMGGVGYWLHKWIGRISSTEDNLAKHEDACGERYENIDKRFDKMEADMGEMKNDIGEIKETLAGILARMDK